ncbi:hypothetical protein, partial [Kitasatospora sp. P5_F3]
VTSRTALGALLAAEGGPQGWARCSPPRAVRRRAAGLVAAARGEPTLAVECLAASAESFQDAGFAAQRALTLALGAPIAAAAGDRRRADAWLDEADRLAAETGAGSIAAQAPPRPAQARSPRRPPPSG